MFYKLATFLLPMHADDIRLLQILSTKHVIY